MDKIKFLILGGGPAGLTFANRLLQKGEENFLVLEKEQVAGGLCRSTIVDGAPFDIGGGHFLDVRRPKVNEFLFGFMPKEEWNLYKRDSRIRINDIEISHPIEANIWQMKIDDQVEYLKSISQAGCNIGSMMPVKFVDWIYWKLGRRIADDYMIPYNQKMFGEDLNELGTYWLEKLPNVSFEDTLHSCLEHKPYGTQPGHAEFYYPKKYGYGELWTRMAETLGDRIKFSESVDAIDFDKKVVITTEGERYYANRIIVTIPWTSINQLIGISDSRKNNIARLKYSSVETRYYSDDLHTDAHWIYYPDSKLAYHRILVRSNFCTGAKGYWTETNRQRVSMLSDAEKQSYSYMNEYAYPLNTIEKPFIMKDLLEWAESKEVYGLGRWGEWEHYNSDVTVGRALDLADKMGG